VEERKKQRRVCEKQEGKVGKVCYIKMICQGVKKRPANPGERDTWIISGFKSFWEGKTTATQLINRGGRGILVGGDKGQETCSIPSPRQAGALDPREKKPFMALFGRMEKKGEGGGTKQPAPVKRKVRACLAAGREGGINPELIEFPWGERGKQRHHLSQKKPPSRKKGERSRHFDEKASLEKRKTARKGNTEQL